MALNQRDVEVIERIIYKSGEDTAVSIARSFERLEERVDALEARISARVADAEDKLEAVRQDLADDISQVRGDVRELLADKE